LWNLQHRRTASAIWYQDETTVRRPRKTTPSGRYYDEFGNWDVYLRWKGREGKRFRKCVTRVEYVGTVRGTYNGKKILPLLYDRRVSHPFSYLVPYRKAEENILHASSASFIFPSPASNPKD
jgi:hypothetical protein